MTQSLEDLLQSVGNPIHFLRNSQAPAFAFPIVPAEFGSWRNDQRAWRESVVIFDQSYHMASLRLRGPDAIPLLERLGVNSFRNFQPGKAKQYVVCNYDGYFIGDAVLFYTAEHELWLVGRPPALNWVQFHAAAGNERIEVQRRDRASSDPGGAAVERDHYRFQVVGPNAPALFERLNGGPVPEIKFFNFARLNIGPHRTNALRHSMAGAPGFEIWGPYAERQVILDTILEAGREFGLRRGGARAYGTSTGESSWIPAPVPAVYTGERMKPYREWLPAVGYESFNSVGGSFASDNIEDYYVTPFSVGYGKMIKFDHDFVGRGALERLVEQPQRKRVTFVWNPDDLMSLIASNLAPGNELPFKMPDFPVLNYSAAPYDRVMRGDQVVGLSMWTTYSYNERAVLGVGIVDPGVALDDVLTLVWGEEGGGTRKPTVEPHRQAKIRVKIAPSPYAEAATKNRTEAWMRREPA
jgi:vanillate/3-O-methylgallate O-demethylase